MPTGTQPLPSPLSQHVGRILSDAIVGQGLAQARVADDAGISASQLSRALAGKKVFTLDQLDAVCSVLGLDLIEVIAAADVATKNRPRPARGELIHAEFGVRGNAEDRRAVAKKKSRDPGGDEGDF